MRRSSESHRMHLKSKLSLSGGPVDTLKGRRLLNACVLIALSSIAISPSVRAEVTDSAQDGFTIKTSVVIRASPADVYKRLVGEIGNWWHSGHTFSGDAHNL